MAHLCSAVAPCRSFARTFCWWNLTSSPVRKPWRPACCFRWAGDPRVPLGCTHALFDQSNSAMNCVWNTSSVGCAVSTFPSLAWWTFCSNYKYRFFVCMLSTLTEEQSFVYHVISLTLIHVPVCSYSVKHQHIMQYTITIQSFSALCCFFKPQQLYNWVLCFNIPAP